MKLKEFYLYHMKGDQWCGNNVLKLLSITTDYSYEYYCRICQLWSIKPIEQKLFIFN